MGKFDHILIVSDMDGTFLGTGGTIVARNIEAIHYFQREGGRFTFATGRMHLNLAKRLPQVYDLPRAYGIMANGTCLFDFETKQVIEAIYVDPASMTEALRMAHDKYPDLGIRVTTSTGFLTTAFEGIVAKDLFYFKDITEVKPIEEWTGEDWYKVVIRGEHDRLVALREEVEAKWPGQFTIVMSEPRFLEFQRAGCTKASLLRRLREIYTEDGIKPTIYAVGDYENDYDMLREADVAVCPTNALDMVKQICSIQPCSNDEGVIAALIEHIEAGL